jgi:LPS O-antigen subunit length determinant protein (WzzB/FepE family)
LRDLGLEGRILLTLKKQNVRAWEVLDQLHDCPLFKIYTALWSQIIIIIIIIIMLSSAAAASSSLKLDKFSNSYSSN